MQIQQSPGLGLVRSPKTACKVGKLKGKSMFHYFTNLFPQFGNVSPDTEQNGTYM